MDQLSTTELISITVSVFSFAFAIWQYINNRRMKKLISLEAVELHNNVSFALGATQAAKNAIVDGQSPSNEIGRAEGLCQAILHESAKLYCNLSNTKVDDIDDLISSGQLKESYKNIYYSYSGTKRGYFRLFMKWLCGIY